jgi:hypothetical protein
LFRPLLGVAIGYKMLDERFDFPVSHYDNAAGFELFGGFERDNYELRIGFMNYRHDDRSWASNGNNSGSTLGLSAIFMEISYSFSLPDRRY